MKYLILIWLVLCAHTSAVATQINPSEIIHAAEQNDFEQLSEMFDSNQSISIEDAQRILLDTFAILKYRFHWSDDEIINEMKEQMFSFVRSAITDPELINEVEECISVLLDNIQNHEDEYNYFYQSTPSHLASQDILNCKSKKKKKIKTTRK